MSQALSTAGNGRLYIVATPIGNLEDLSPRAIRVLSEVAAIAAEDTRHTGRLLSHFGLKQPLLALHDHNESDFAPALITRLLNGEDLALVSDAGTPLVSDPGYRLTRLAAEAGIEVIAVPGPSAVLAALSIAGLPTNSFIFAGFLPAKLEARERALREFNSERRTVVFFESVHRVGDTLKQMSECFGPAREVALCRELTKRHEQVYRGSSDELHAQFERGEIKPKGEFVVVLGGSIEEAAAPPDSLDELLGALLSEVPVKTAVKVAQALTGLSRNEVYTKALALKVPSGVDAAT